MLTSLVLSPTTRSQLQRKYAHLIEPLLNKGYQLTNARGEPLIHHATLQLGSHDPTLNPDMEGQKVAFYLVEFGISEKAAAFGIQCVTSEHNQATVSLFGQPAVKSTNRKPHITVAINPRMNGRPQSSNEIRDWKSLEDAIQIMGVFTIDQ